jgi:hypothetical protein
VTRRTRRQFLRALGLAAAGAGLPWYLGSPAPVSACAEALEGLDAVCGPFDDTPEGAVPSFEPWWVRVFSPTLLWPTGVEGDEPLGPAEFGQYFRVQEPQDGPQLRVWDPRGDRMGYVEAESVGPVEPPEWAEYLNGLDGRWIDVKLSIPQRAVAMQGDQAVRDALVTAGLNGSTRPGGYRILRRVYNETMDSRTVPGLRDRYLLRNVLFTQYFANDGSAIHYNWWFPPGGFGRPGSHGCLGMMYNDSRFFWEWADIGVPVIIHA